MEASTEEKQDQQQQEEREESREDGQGAVGRVEEVQGVVIEAVFPDNELPEINNALELELEDTESDVAGADAQPEHGGGNGSKRTLICEVQQHLGDDRIRAVAMDSTDGLSRGAEVRDTGGPISVPVGEATLGRIFNLLGETI